MAFMFVFLLALICASVPAWAQEAPYYDNLPPQAYGDQGSPEDWGDPMDPEPGYIPDNGPDNGLDNGPYYGNQDPYYYGNSANGDSVQVLRGSNPLAPEDNAPRPRPRATAPGRARAATRPLARKTPTSLRKGTTKDTLRTSRASATRGGAATSRSGFQPTGSNYLNAKPQWALELTGSVNGLSGAELATPDDGSSIRGFSARFEYQPKFLQSFGVLSIGPSASLYPALPNNGVTRHGALSIWSAGGQIRYQARLMRQQVLVPTLGYFAERWSYKLGTELDGQFLAQGPMVGGMLLLNWFDHSAATDAYMNLGLARSYLVAELRQQSGGDDNLKLDGRSFFFGLRFEY